MLRFVRALRSCGNGQSLICRWVNSTLMYSGADHRTSLLEDWAQLHVQRMFK